MLPPSPCRPPFSEKRNREAIKKIAKMYIITTPHIVRSASKVFIVGAPQVVPGSQPPNDWKSFKLGKLSGFTLHKKINMLIKIEIWR